MKINDIIALTNAGWSKDEIIRMAGIELPAPAPAPAPEPAQENETIKLLKELTGLVRMGNINNINQPDQQQPDAAELLAKIMNP